MKAATPGQTVGPFFHTALPYSGDCELVPPGRGDAVRLHGRVLDGDGIPVPDALVEVWQADELGVVPRSGGSIRRDGHTFTGFGRASTDREGRYTFTTVVPGSVGGGLPFFALTVFARGLLHRLFTRAYLPPGDGGTDALLASVEPDRRHTLVCTPDGRGFVFDIRLMGEDETVFLAFPEH